MPNPSKLKLHPNRQFHSIRINSTKLWMFCIYKKQKLYSRSDLQFFTVPNNVTPLIQVLCLLIEKAHPFISRLFFWSAACTRWDILYSALVKGTVVLWARFRCFTAGLWLQPKSILISHLNISALIIAVHYFSQKLTKKTKRKREDLLPLSLCSHIIMAPCYIICQTIKMTCFGWLESLGFTAITWPLHKYISPICIFIV